MEEDTINDDWSDYDSGPFCRHWGDPWECEYMCKNCGKTCANHNKDNACDNFEDV